MYCLLGLAFFLFKAKASLRALLRFHPSFRVAISSSLMFFDAFLLEFTTGQNKATINQKMPSFIMVCARQGTQRAIWCIPLEARRPTALPSLSSLRNLRERLIFYATHQQPSVDLC